MQRRDFRLVRGNDLTFSGLTARDDFGAVINLTGATMKWRIGPRGQHSTLTTKTPTVTSAPGGVYSLRLDGADSKSWTPQRLRHEVEAVVGGNTHLVLEGFIDLEKDLP